MTETEIIKAVESCLQLTEECGVCPLQENTHCHELLLAELKKLLNSYKEIIKSHEKAEHFAEKAIEAQEKEIEKLNVELFGMRGACESYKIHHDKAQTKLEKLRNAWKEYTSKTKYCIEVLQTQLAQAKSEAYRELAEKLKEISKEVTVSYVADTAIQEHKTGMFYYEKKDFDNLVKEIT